MDHARPIYAVCVATTAGVHWMRRKQDDASHCDSGEAGGWCLCREAVVHRPHSRIRGTPPLQAHHSSHASGIMGKQWNGVRGIVQYCTTVVGTSGRVAAKCHSHVPLCRRVGGTHTSVSYARHSETSEQLTQLSPAARLACRPGAQS